MKKPGKEVNIFSVFFACLNRPMNLISNYTLSSLINRDTNYELLLKIAEENKVASIVLESLDQLGLINKVPAKLVSKIEKKSIKTKTILTELDRLSKIIFSSHYQWVVLENGGIARRYFPQQTHLFSFGDLDLLVDPTELYEISNILMLQGYGILSTNENRVVLQREIDSGINLRLNLQCFLVARKWFSFNYGFDTSRLVKNSFPIPTSKARVLCPEEFLIQLCIHTASHTLIRSPGIRLHMDVDWFLRSEKINWTIFLKEIFDHKLTNIAFWGLYIPKVLLGTPIPDEIIDSLSQQSWKQGIIKKIVFPMDIYAINDHPNPFIVILLNVLLTDNLQHLWKMFFGNFLGKR